MQLRVAAEEEIREDNRREYAAQDRANWEKLSRVGKFREYIDTCTGPCAYRGLAEDEIRKQLAALTPHQEPPHQPPLSKPHAAGENCASRTQPAGVDTYCASSMLGAQAGNTYGVRHLFDGDNA